MSAAAKHFDPILGIDVHMIQPPGPVPPVPVPHPHTGMLLDPFDYAPFVGGTVTVGGLQRAQAGTASVSIPPHIPIGGVFVKPPANEGEMFMGSSTVAVDGDAFSYLALPLLTCHDVGMPAPGRPKGSPPKSLVLPTTVVLSIPLPVSVGGGPTVSLTQLAMAAGLKALGAGFNKFVKNSDKWKKFSKALQNRAKKAMDKLGIPPNLQRKVGDAICSVTGHPVDVAAGKLFTSRVDLDLPGPIRFQFERRWLSCSTYRGPLGHGWHHSYDLALHVEDKVVLARLADGRYVAFPSLLPGATAYNRQDRLTLGCDAQGYWLRDLEGTTHRFVRIANRSPGYRALGMITDRAGHRISFRYDTTGWLVEAVTSFGRTFGFRNDGQGRLVAIDGPHPRGDTARVVLMRYAYDGDGNLVEARDALGKSQHFRWRGHLLVRETDRNGHSFYFEYDHSITPVRCIRTWGDAGIYDHKLRYMDDHGATVVEDSLGNRTTYHHDGAVVHELVDAYGNRRSRKFDADYKVLEEVDELGAVTTWEYDERGNAVAVTTPEGATVRFEYDDRDLRTKMIDLMGQEWTWVYDEHGRVIERVDPLGYATRFAYRGPWLVSMTDPGEGYTALHYDAFGNLARVERPLMATSEREHDRLGRVVAVTDAAGNTERRVLDLLGRVVRAEEPDGNVRELAYDGEGNIVRFTDRRYDMRLTYRGTGRIASRTQAGTTVAFEYDTEEQVVAIVNEHGRRFTLEYGRTGLVDTETTFGGARRRYTRDAAGNITRIDMPSGRWSEHQYDAMGRRIQTRHSDRTREHFAYRPDGRLRMAVNPEASVEFEHDAIGRNTGEICGPHWVRTRFDALGFRTRITSSLGADQRIDRTALGDVTRVVSGAFEATYRRDVLGLELERELPGGVRSSWERDRLGRPLQHEIFSGPRCDRSIEYSWDVDYRLTARTCFRRGTTRFGHDGRGALAWVQHRDGTVEMRMPDGVGNLFRTEDRSDRSYGPSGELLSSRTDRGVTRYEYDADGNLVCKLEPSGATWRYRWNAAGMLHRVVRPDGSVVDFGYDALGRRLYKRHAGKVTRWVWHRNVPLHEWTEDVQAADEGDDALPGESPDPEILRRQAELNDRLPQGPPIAGTKDAPVTWLFNPDGFAPLGAQVGDRSYAFVTDPLGAPVAVYDEHGALLWSGDVDSWGRLRDVDDRALWQPFRFPGQYEDVETGLYYNRFRYYDPEAGQYISEDPISFAGGLNPHAYVDDPLRYCDPFGLYNGEGERELGVYDTFHDHDLDEADWQSSRPQHFKKCNESLYNAMEKDSALKAAIEEKYPGTYEHVKPGPKGGFADSSPPGLTWHHADAPGKMELVDRVDHRKYHKIYHPDGSGGYKKWGKSCH